MFPNHVLVKTHTIVSHDKKAGGGGEPVWHQRTWSHV